MLQHLTEATQVVRARACSLLFLDLYLCVGTRACSVIESKSNSDTGSGRKELSHMEYIPEGFNFSSVAGTDHPAHIT